MRLACINEKRDPNDFNLRNPVAQILSFSDVKVLQGNSLTWCREAKTVHNFP